MINLFVLLISLTMSGLGGVAASQSAKGPTPDQARAAHEIVAQLQKFELIKRIEIKTGKFYLDGPLWQGFELTDKKKFIRAMSVYRETEYMGLPQVTLYDSRSGKELANYGPLLGTTIR